jgi:hypothetical protein
MAQRTVSPSQAEKLVLRMNQKERTFLSIILMNKGDIPETRFKRVFMEKNTFWDLQSIKSRFTIMGLLDFGEERDSGDPIYMIPRRYHEGLQQVLSSRMEYDDGILELVPEFQTCCEEYSILWHLSQIDYETGLHILSGKRKRWPRISNQKVQDVLGIEERETGFLLDLVSNLSQGKFFKKNGIKKWGDTQNDPHILIKKIYKMIYYELRENGILGSEDIGKDNIDFLIDELAQLEVGRWYPLKIFINNARDTLFAANQPYRWIQFEKESIWNILNMELRLIGSVQTTRLQDGRRFFTPTPLGAYCFDGISEDEFQIMLGPRAGNLMVHPNFEVTLVTKELHPGILLALGMFTDPVKLDTMSVFRMSRGSVKKGMDFGLKPDDMLDLLKNNSKGEVPQNVEYSIMDWGT